MEEERGSDAHDAGRAKTQHHTNAATTQSTQPHHTSADVVSRCTIRVSCPAKLRNSVVLFRPNFKEIDDFSDNGIIADRRLIE